MWKRLAALFAMFCIGFTLLYIRLLSISTNEEYAQIAQTQTGYTLTLSRTAAGIYDRNYHSLVNVKTAYLAAVYPTEEALSLLAEYAADPEALKGKQAGGLPFVCEVTTPYIACGDILVMEVPVRYSEDQLAAHLIGYTADGVGVCGIERAFDDFLRGHAGVTTVTYRMDSQRELIPNRGVEVNASAPVRAGVVTTLDADIQRICESAALGNMTKGAVVVMEPYTGEILALVSMPGFDPADLEESLVDTENTPMINRALLPYNLGSIFKLCTAAAALEQGISPDFTNDCTGSIDVSGQLFHCHKLSGHGVLDMEGAIVQSCNTYFISLVSHLDVTAYLRMAAALSFGRSTNLAEGILASAGYLQSEADLINPAELANLSFGQGKLTATPVQVAQMTAAIVNGGQTPQAQLIVGLSEDGETLSESMRAPRYTAAMSEETAELLMGFMRSMVKEETRVGVRPEHTTAGGKTATAQTGKFDEQGNEIIQGWFTGFTPAYNPQYVITVLVEDGGSGYTSAGPIFKEIADGLYGLGK